MRFKGLDLNLLVTLKALLEARSVSAAAAKLHVTQPAVSAALKKLREYFEDELLLTSGKQLLLTPHAMQLLPELQRLLSDIDVFVTKSSRFEPSTTERHFVLAANDYFTSVMLAPVIMQINRLAPGLRLTILPVSEAAEADLQRGDIDLAFFPEPYLVNQHYTETLFEEDLVVLCCANNQSLPRAPSVADIAQSAQVMANLGQVPRQTMVQRLFRRLGLTAKIAVETPSFLVAPTLLPNTELITVVHRRLALQACRSLPLNLIEFPVSAQPYTAFNYCSVMHPARRDDTGLRWLLGLIQSELAVEPAS